MRLGIIDWGIGGLDCFARIRERCPDLDVVYFSDAGHRPYGRVESAPLTERVAAIVEMIDADRVIIACNAASTILKSLRLSVPVEGVITHGVAAALATNLHGIGVIGGERTIESGAYSAPLRKAGRRVVENVAQPLSALVETGRLEGIEVEYAVAQILKPLGSIECLVLACTHYPALAPVFERLVPEVVLVDPIHSLVAHTIESWALDTQPGEGRTRIWTTGEIEQTQRSARQAFGLELTTVEAWR